MADSDRFVATGPMVANGFSRGKIPKRKGSHRYQWTWEALADFIDSPAGAQAFAGVVNAMLDGRAQLPPMAARFLRSGTQLALHKDKRTGVRPAVQGR